MMDTLAADLDKEMQEAEFEEFEEKDAIGCNKMDCDMKNFEMRQTARDEFHQECDFVMKSFEIRRTARDEFHQK